MTKNVPGGKRRETIVEGHLSHDVTMQREGETLEQEGAVTWDGVCQAEAGVDSPLLTMAHPSLFHKHTLFR